MKAESMPSFAPVVIVTSLSGSSVRPKDLEYASAIAFFSLGRPYWRHLACCPHSHGNSTSRTLVGEYWLHSTLPKASLAASRTNSGGLYPKKPWPMLTMGWTGEAWAPSLTMVLQLHQLALYSALLLEYKHTKHPAVVQQLLLPA